MAASSKKDTLKNKKAVKKTTKKQKDDSENVKPIELTEGFVTNAHYAIGRDIPRTKSKISIVGFAPSSMSDVQYVWDDPEMEVWGLNQLYMAWRGTNLQDKFLEKTTRWFQIHHKASYESAVGRDHSHHEWLASRDTFPIYMQQKEDSIPSSVPFPMK